jgi:K+-transporting ATPase ATPase C chain
LMTLLLLIITCGIYPGAVWLVGQLVFHDHANGSLVVKNGTAIGSKLIAQNFVKPEYFHPRPSSAGDKGFDAANSSGSNLAMTNKKFIDGVNANIKQVQTENPELKMGAIPADMVMGSASGLDPDISPENALIQVTRVAKARQVAMNDVKDLVDKNTEKPDLNFLGEAHVNVLKLNLALDESFPLKK